MSVRVRLEGVRKFFDDGFEVIKDFSLTVQRGAFHFLIGPSGSGKTTLLRMIAGLEKVSSGKIYFNDEEVKHRPAAERGIGMVFQNYALWPHMTVYENVAYPLKIQNISKEERLQRLEEVFDMTQLGDLKNRYPSELSGGQQQRVAVARAIVIRPKVLLFDEPLSNLDARLRTSMRDGLIKLHNDLKVTAIYVTHDQQEALSMGTQVTVMNHGKIVQTGSPRELYLRPNSIFLAGFIGSTNFIHKAKIQGFNKINKHRVAVLNTRIGVIQAEMISDNLQLGDRVCLSIRLESIKIDLGRRELASKVNVFVGKLLRIIYLGDVDQLHVLLKGGTVLKISLFNAPDYNLLIGDEVTCFFKPSKVVVLPESL